jgi:hypothetical protein
MNIAHTSVGLKSATFDVVQGLKSLILIIEAHHNRGYSLYFYSRLKVVTDLSNPSNPCICTDVDQQYCHGSGPYHT